jgi:hypothetical protein
MGEVCSTRGETRNANKILVAKPSGLLGRPRRGWYGNLQLI